MCSKGILCQVSVIHGLKSVTNYWVCCYPFLTYERNMGELEILHYLKFPIWFLECVR